MLSICVKIANSCSLHFLEIFTHSKFTKLCLYIFQPFHGLYIEHAFNSIVLLSPSYIDELCIYNQSLQSLPVNNQNSKNKQRKCISK